MRGGRKAGDDALTVGIESQQEFPVIVNPW